MWYRLLNVDRIEGSDKKTEETHNRSSLLVPKQDSVSVYYGLDEITIQIKL